MKNLLHSLAICLAILAVASTANAQCGPDFSPLHIQITTDNYPYETSWYVQNSSGEIIADGVEDTDTTICIATGECSLVVIEDAYGDGIFSPGGYVISYEGEIVAQGGSEFDDATSVEVGCQEGESCSDPVIADLGTHSTSFANEWYSFTPAETGLYQITTCQLNDCDTRLGVYQNCNPLTIDDSNEGTLYYDDDAGGCGQQAQINIPLEADQPILLRVFTDPQGDCGGQIDFDINFNGPIEGCTDPEACNYNPLAEVSSGNCIYPGDPECPDGPDLKVVEEELQTSLYTDQITVGSNNCYINEGCLNGYGTRDLIRFSTHIQNVGETDYYIGNPEANPTQFTYDNCHNHYHYEGYAEYLLYTQDGEELPMGFKNGFCVMDLECENGGSSQYGCSNMGISKDCGDIYNSSLSCQWIDVTDVEDGTYTLVVRVNWDHDPDAIGRYENTYDNNWGQVCIDIDRSSGQLEVTQIDDCPEYVDCSGQPFGNAELDCAGVCNGSHMEGDLNQNEAYEINDANAYSDGIMADTLIASSCTDLNSDNSITVTDAALMSLCNIYTIMEEDNPDLYHTNCDFPKNDITNPFDTMKVRMGTLNTDENFFDIEVSNKWKKMVGYELKLSGIEIAEVEDLTPGEYPIQPEFNADGIVYGLSYQDSSLNKSAGYQPLVRVHYQQMYDTEICIDSIIDLVNGDYENPVMVLEDNCINTSGIENLDDPYLVKVAPNPFNNSTTLRIGNWNQGEVSLQLIDVSGRIVRDYGVLNGNRIEIKREGLDNGMYFYRLQGRFEQTGRLMLAH